MLITKESLENSKRFLKQVRKILFWLLSWGKLCNTMLEHKYDISCIGKSQHWFCINTHIAKIS
jgi:hypothetical protein